MSESYQDSKYMIIDGVPIPKHVYDNWQSVLDLVADIMDVPAALIMKVHKREIEVFVSSKTERNPYRPGDKEKLDSGLYCETVMNTKKMLIVPDALADEEWNSNPDVKLNMISYMGAPLTWPHGEIFGTICVLDDHRRDYSELLQNTLSSFSHLLNYNLQLIFQEHENKIKIRELGALHDMKDKMFSLALHDLRLPASAIKVSLDFILKNEAALNPILMDMLRAVSENNSRMIDLLDGFLNTADLSIVDVELKKTDIDLFAEVKKSVWEVETIARPKGVSVIAEQSDVSSEKISLDRDKIRQVLSSLLNACVHISDNGDTLRVQYEDVIDDRVVRISFMNESWSSGEPGVIKLCDAFSTIDDDFKSIKGQTLINIFIARKMIEAHGGRVSYYEDAHEGVSFFMTLPFSNLERE